MSQLLALYNNVGNDQFSQMVCQVAPFFSTITPEFTALRPSYCEAAVKFRREITNHLGTVHAIAMCNAAELVDWSGAGDVIVPVEIFDTNNIKVFSARITMNIKAA